MRGRIYTVPLTLSVTSDATQDIWVIAAPADRKAILHGFSLTSAYTTDERALLTLLRRSGAGTGGGSATEVKLDADNSLTAESVVTTLVTTQGTPGDVLKSWYWSQQNELLYLPTPELRPATTAGGFIALALGTALARDWAGWVCWEEE